MNDRTILYSIDGTIGKIARYRGEKVILGKGACYIKLKETVNADYIYYLLQSSIFQAYLKSMTTGSTIHHISLETMRNFSFALPDRVIQDCIAKVLLVIDQKIDLNTRICTELESMARTIYDYWFAQFDFPDENGKPYRTSGGEMMWCQELRREVPKGWKVSKLGTECKTLLGGTPDTSICDYWDGDIPWLSSGEVASSPVVSSEKTITESGKVNSTTSFAHAGAVVISITRYIRPSILGIDACFNQSIVAVIPTDTFHTSFIYPLMKSAVINYMNLRTGAQQPHINKETIDNTVILCPPIDVLKQYYQKVECLFKRQLLLTRENQHLTYLRDWLLPMLMNGQAKVVL